MLTLKAFDLCKEKTEWVEVNVWAEIENGCLKISGVDYGNAVTEWLGRDEHEYWYSFDEINTELLITQLTTKEQDLKKALLEEFGGLEGCNRLREFCRTNNIEYEFGTWTP